jgi:hypothetical protein
MSSLLEKSANVFLIAASAVVLGQYCYRTLHKPSPQWQRALAPDERIQDSVALGLNSAPRTMLIVTAHNCPFCIASMPFYKRVADAARRRGTRALAVTFEDLAENQKFLESYGVKVEKVLSAAAVGVRVNGVPSLVLVRQDGVVIDSWVGQPENESLERMVLRMVGAP